MPPWWYPGGYTRVYMPPLYPLVGVSLPYMPGTDTPTGTTGNGTLG